MKTDKLFQCMVVGGALLLGNTLLANEPSELEEILQESDLAPVFCNRPENCEQSANGDWVVKDGLECCWNTACEAPSAE